jgi:hypothetical protein
MNSSESVTGEDLAAAALPHVGDGKLGLTTSTFVLL